jgi:hypothetical protein
LFAEQFNSYLKNAADVEDVADRLIQLRAWPRNTFQSITFALQSPEIDNADRDALLNIFMGQPVRITNLPLNILGGEFTGFIEGWTFNASVSGLSVTFLATPTEFSAFAHTALPIGSTGQVLTVAAGVPSWATPTGDIEGITTGTDSGLSGGATSGTVTLRLKLEFDAETGTTYTLLAANLNQLVTLNNASSITLTVPPSVFSAGDVINIAQIGAGQVTLAQGAGVTINSTGATATAPKLRARYSAASIICTASNTFLVVGDIA